MTWRTTTGGHFACACVQPLYKEGVIAVIKMAREIQIVLFMFIWVSFLIVSFTIQGNRAAEKCTVCGKTVGEDGRPASGYKKDFISCFGIDANTDGKICGQCKKVFLCKYDKFQIVSYIKCNRLKMKHF